MCAFTLVKQLVQHKRTSMQLDAVLSLCTVQYGWSPLVGNEVRPCEGTAF